MYCVGKKYNKKKRLFDVKYPVGSNAIYNGYERIAGRGYCAATNLMARSRVNAIFSS